MRRSFAMICSGGKALAGHLGLLLAGVEFSLSTRTRNNQSRHLRPVRLRRPLQEYGFNMRAVWRTELIGKEFGRIAKLNRRAVKRVAYR